MDLTEDQHDGPAPLEFPNLPDTNSLSTVHPDVQRMQEQNRLRAEKFGIPFVEPNVRQQRQLKGEAKRYSNPFEPKQGTAFVAGIDFLSEEEKNRREIRAKKFGLPLGGFSQPSAATDQDGAAVIDDDEDVDSMDIDFREGKKEVIPDDGEEVVVRRDALHLYGTDEMSTRDVFQYMTGYGPAFVEWINDSSCNVAFNDESSAGHALYALSKGECVKTTDPTVFHKAPRSKTSMPIQVRYATDKDVRPDLPNPEARWSAKARKERKKQTGRTDRLLIRCNLDEVKDQQDVDIVEEEEEEEVEEEEEEEIKPLTVEERLNAALPSRQDSRRREQQSKGRRGKNRKNNRKNQAYGQLGKRTVVFANSEDADRFMGPSSVISKADDRKRRGRGHLPEENSDQALAIFERAAEREAITNGEESSTPAAAAPATAGGTAMADDTTSVTITTTE